MVNPCLADQYLDYKLAAQITRMGLARALAALQGVPDVPSAVAAATFSSPAGNRLRTDVTNLGDGVADAETRIAELIAYLRAIEAKYERLWLAAEAERERLAKK